MKGRGIVVTTKLLESRYIKRRSYYSMDKAVFLPWQTGQLPMTPTLIGRGFLGK